VSIFCINIMHHLAFHIFKSESHKIFFSIKGSTRFKSGPTSSFKVSSHLQHSCKQKERTYQFKREIHEHSWRGNNTPGRVREIEHLVGITGSFAESAAVPARAQTPTSTAASTTGSKDAVWPNPNDLFGIASHLAQG